MPCFVEGYLCAPFTATTTNDNYHSFVRLTTYLHHPAFPHDPAPHPAAAHTAQTVANAAAEEARKMEGRRPLTAAHMALRALLLQVLTAPHRLTAHSFCCCNAASPTSLRALLLHVPCRSLVLLRRGAAQYLPSSYCATAPTPALTAVAHTPFLFCYCSYLCSRRRRCAATATATAAAAGAPALTVMALTVMALTVMALTSSMSSPASTRRIGASSCSTSSGWSVELNQP